MKTVERIREWIAWAKPVAVKLAPLMGKALWDVSTLVMTLQSGNIIDPAIKLPQQTEAAVRSLRELLTAIYDVWKQRKGGPADQQEPPRHQD